MQVIYRVISHLPNDCLILLKCFGFIPLSGRTSAFETELAKLNASGAMGGDPLNRIKSGTHDHTHSRIVRDPVSDGHVFRSKVRDTCVAVS